MLATDVDVQGSGKSDPVTKSLRIGMLLPSSNPMAEPEIARMLPPGVSVLTTRLKLAGSSREELLGMTEKLEEASQLPWTPRSISSFSTVQPFRPLIRPWEQQSPAAWRPPGAVRRPNNPCPIISTGTFGRAFPVSTIFRSISQF